MCSLRSSQWHFIFDPILFRPGSTSNYINLKGHSLCLAIGKPIQASILGSAPYSKNIGDGPIKRNLSFFFNPLTS